VPEGDTIHTLASALGPDLRGKRLLEVDLRDRPGAGRLQSGVVQDVFAIGKHLIILTDQGVALRSHLGMEGSWHRYRPDEAWRGPKSTAGIVLTTKDRVLVCFQPSQVDVFTWGDRGHHRPLAMLGPDLIDVDVDPDVLVSRARAAPLTRDGRVRMIAEILLDQRVAAGIGNVFKSEVLFVHGVDPWTPLPAVADDVLVALYQEAARWLRYNVGRLHRVTAPRYTNEPSRRRGRGLWVYGRDRLQCRRCGTLIRTRKLGEQPRGTWWCRVCQPAI
jgi:endonuclease-8